MGWLATIWPWRKPPSPPAPAAAQDGAVAAPASDSRSPSRITPYAPGVGRVMVTDFGPHPPDFWAQVTAEHVTPFGHGLGGGRLKEAMKLRAAIQETLEPHHTRVQLLERVKLGDGHARLMAPLDPEPHGAAALDAVIAAAQGTAWEAHFARPEVQAEIRAVLDQHFASAQHIERSWHVDRYPGHPDAAAFAAQRTGG